MRVIRRLLAFVFLAAATSAPQAAPPSSHADLERLFADWRTFQQPRLVDGVPDYRTAAMAAQQQALPGYRARLAAIDTTGWTIPERVDWYVVRAEMDGLDFDHRVLRPWANNPAFYVTVFDEQSDQPAREGPLARGAVELWQYTYPLSREDADRVDAGLRPIPALLDQAKTNLTGNGHDVWLYAAASFEEQSAALAGLISRAGAGNATLVADARRAKSATETFASWVKAESAKRTGASGIGVANYDWYLKHVQLVPYTWRDELALMDRELARARAFLALEESRNASLPPELPVASADEHAKRFPAAVHEYMAFLKDHAILTVRPDMEPALMAKIGHFAPAPWEFFTEVDYRDPEIMRTHGYHWFDLARMKDDPHPSAIRRVPLLYNIFNTRTEGHATGWEELMLQAGMFDARPRSRELIYVLLAERAARALGDLRMQSNEFTLEQAAEFASKNTPRQWLRLDGKTVRGEQHLYLQQPAYGTSYLTGKIQIEALLAERRAQLGDRFTMRGFMDEFNAAGLIPASLLRWELTGRLPDEEARMLDIAR